MAEIVKAVSPRLKANRFKKRRYGFNRRTDDGLVHVVHFWMAPFELPAWTEVPGLRERRYGNFRIDLGVWCPEMARLGQPKTEWVNEYNCQLRATIGQMLEPPVSDFWWPLDEAGVAETAWVTLSDYGLPWLDRFWSKDAILEAFETHGARDLGMPPAGPLDIADLYDGLGDVAAARRTLEAYVASGVRSGHADYLAQYLDSRGHGDLVLSIKRA